MDHKIGMILTTFIVSIVGFVLLPTYVDFVVASQRVLVNDTNTVANYTTARTLVGVTPVFYVLLLLALPIGGVYAAFKL